MAESSSSKWLKCLESRLGKLSESSSKESFQTLARWIIFHRKHLEEFTTPIRLALATPARGPIVISVLHSLFLSYKGKTTKWNELANLRVQMAEQCLVNSQSVISTEGAAALKTHLNEWDSNACFGGPGVVHRLKRKLNQEDKSPEDTRVSPVETVKKDEVQGAVTPAAETPTPQSAEPIAVDDDNDFPMDDNPPDSSLIQEPELERKEFRGNDDMKRKVFFGDDDPGSAKRRSTSIPDVSKFKFEELDLPERAVDPSELMDPCRTIATLQIARDLRAESVLRLATLLQELPVKVRAQVVESSETGNFTLDDNIADELSRLVPDELLDLDVNQQLVSVRNYRTLVEQQNTARLTVIRLLQESRCKFGSNDIAQAYNSLTDVQHYNDRSQQLVDMLELEGLDMDTVLAKEQKLEQPDQAFAGTLPPISWYEELNKANDAAES